MRVLHEGVDDPDELWVYETWENVEAVGWHESGPRFLAYEDGIRPLVDGPSVLWGNATPIAMAPGAVRRDERALDRVDDQAVERADVLLGHRPGAPVARWAQYVRSVVSGGVAGHGRVDLLAAGRDLADTPLSPA